MFFRQSLLFLVDFLWVMRYNVTMGEEKIYQKGVTTNAMEKIISFFRHLSTTQIILLEYCGVIFLGTLLLCLPISIQQETGNTLLNAFFTATSATCVTGLVLVDTCTHWTTFGQVVILCLIQIGGIGFMTFCILILSVTGRKIGLFSRSLMQNSISAPQLGGIVRMTRFIFLASLLVETIGALFLAFFFCPRYGVGKGIWFSFFHSISAFCNAGFDLMGESGAFSSFIHYTGNWYLNLVIMALIVLGGLGFFVWRDILDNKMKMLRMHLHTKLVLFVTALLIFGGAFFFFLLEQNSVVFSRLPLDEQILSSLFQSVTVRTAGFNTLPLNELTESSKFLSICLMLIGGSTGSTAGGIKTTTFAILVLSIFSIFFHRKQIEVFGRRMEEGIVRSASCIFMLYLFLSCTAAMIIARIEHLPFLDTLFECVSAIATVGLTTGITPTLMPFSSLLLAFLMIFGRVGSLTMLLAFSSSKPPSSSSLPLEKVQIG